MNARVLIVAGALMATASSAGAQARIDSTDSVALTCPRGGVQASAWVSGVRVGTGAAATTPARGVLDTVITLNITDRTWQRDSLSAGVSLGAAGQAGSQRGRWHACAGATTTLGRITATLHNVHGQIHLRADAGALDAIGRTAGTTPPAPPRR
jgi:hypothetical protein